MPDTPADLSLSRTVVDRWQPPATLWPDCHGPETSQAIFQPCRPSRCALPPVGPRHPVRVWLVGGPAHTVVDARLSLAGQRWTWLVHPGRSGPEPPDVPIESAADKRDTGGRTRRRPAGLRFTWMTGTAHCATAAADGPVTSPSVGGGRSRCRPLRSRRSERPVAHALRVGHCQRVDRACDYCTGSPSRDERLTGRSPGRRRAHGARGCLRTRRLPAGPAGFGTMAERWGSAPPLATTLHSAA